MAIKQWMCDEDLLIRRSNCFELKTCDAPTLPLDNAVQVSKYIFTVSFTVRVSSSSTTIPIKRSFLIGKIKTLHGKLCDVPLSCRDAILLRSSSRRSSVLIIMFHRAHILVFQGTSLLRTHKFIDCLTFTEGTIIAATLMSPSEFAPACAHCILS